MALRDSKRHHTSKTSVTTVDTRQEHKSPFHSPTLHFLVHIPISIWCSVAKLQPPLSTCCEPPKGIEIASAFAMSTTSWYFRFLFLRLPMFDLTAWALKTAACTIVPHTEYRLRNPIPSHHFFFFFLHGNCAFGYPLMVVEGSFTDPVHA